MFIAARSRAMTWAASNRFSVNSEFITCKGKMKITNQLLIQSMAAVMVQRKSKHLKTKRPWVRILPAAGLFFSYYPLSNMSLLMYFTNIVFLIFYENWKWTEWIKNFFMDKFEMFRIKTKWTTITHQTSWVRIPTVFPRKATNTSGANNCSTPSTLNDVTSLFHFALPKNI